MDRPWTPEDMTTVWDRYGTWSIDQLAAHLGRTVLAIKCMAQKVGAIKGRLYTAKEKELVRRLWATHTGEQIVRRLNAGRRNRRRIALTNLYQLCVRLGLKKWPRWPPQVLARVRELHAEGLHDMDITRRINAEGIDLGREATSIDRRAISLIRARLKLPVNIKAVKEAGRRAIRAQLKTLGLTSPTELRSRAWRLFAIENGWPEDLVPREVQILNVLAAHGVPMTRLELAKAIGMRTDREDRPGHLALLTGNGPGGTYTATLMRRGLLAVIKRASSGYGQGKNRSLYFLGPAALAILEERARKEATA